MDAEKQKFIDDMQTQLQHLEGRLNDIEAQAGKAEKAMQKEYAEHAKVLSEKLNSARIRLDELNESSEEKWDTAKEQVQEAWDDVNKAFSDATAALSK